MRIVTWNCCRGQYAKKAPILEIFAPDISVVQEIAKPPTESDQCLWFGDNPRQGIAITASNDYRLKRLPTARNVPKYIFPVRITGPTNFTLLAAWTKAGQKYPYVEAAVQATKRYRSLIEAGPTVLIGDLNSNANWDKAHPKGRNHSALVALLTKLGLVSAYHAYFNEAYGAESRPTYYFLWKKSRSYHMDYCFVPEGWVKQIKTVEVGPYEGWERFSDHRPLFVEVFPVAF